VRSGRGPRRRRGSARTRRGRRRAAPRPDSVRPDGGIRPRRTRWCRRSGRTSRRCAG
jgi:hypothetical protein